MITLLLVYYTSTGAMQIVQVPGFVNRERCEYAMSKIVGDVENASEIVPLGWLLISANCIKTN